MQAASEAASLSGSGAVAQVGGQVLRWAGKTRLCRESFTSCLSSNSELIDHAIVNSALLRPIPGMSLTGPLLKMYAPFKNMDWLIRANMKSLGIPAQYFPQFSEETRQITTSSLTHILTANATYRLPAKLDRVRVPVLVVIGQKEYRIMYQSARELVQAVPNAKGYLAEGRTHNWSLEAPDLYTSMIRAWINDLPLPSGLTPLM